MTWWLLLGILFVATLVGYKLLREVPSLLPPLPAA